MWSSKKEIKEQKIVGETNDNKMITFSEILIDNEIDINSLKKLMKEGLDVLKDLTKEERHKVYSVMSYKSGLTFAKRNNKDVELYFRESEESDESDESEELDESDESDESDYSDDSEESEESDSFYKCMLDKVNNKYNKVCNLFAISCSINMLFYLLIIATDPIRLIEVKKCYA